MKNLIIILIIAAFAFSGTAVKAQNKATYDVTLKPDDVLRQYRAKDFDTVSTYKTSFTYTIYNLGQSSFKEKFTNRWEIALDSISGTSDTMRIDYQRRMNIFTTWTTDSTQYFYGSQSDTTLVYNDTVAKPDPYRRIKVSDPDSDGFKIKIDWLSGLFLIE